MTPLKRKRSSSDDSEDHSSESDPDEYEPQEQHNSSSDSSDQVNVEPEESGCEDNSLAFEKASDNTDNMNDSSDHKGISVGTQFIKMEAEDNSAEQSSNKTNSISSTKYIQNLKCDLKALMKLQSPNSDFVTSGLLSDAKLPNIPLICVNGFGLLPFPLNDATFQCLKPFCTAASFGNDARETLADTGRNRYQLDPSQFEIKNETFTNQITLLIQSEIKSGLGLAGDTIYGKIYKLLIFEKGSKSEEQNDNNIEMENNDNLFGTLIVQLPSVFTGGDLVVNHLKSSKVFDNSSSGSSTHCKFVAHYASCPHELKVVTSGYRALLVYSLCWDGTGMKPSPYTASTNAVKLCNTVNLLMDSPKIPFLCWGLKYEYSDANSKQNSVEFFKGKDKHIVAGLKNALDYDRQISGKDSCELYIATAKKIIKESGDCSRIYKSSWCPDGDACSDGCELKETSRSFNVEDFVSLTAGSSVFCNVRSFIIDPPEDIMNFPKDKTHTGQIKRVKTFNCDDKFWGVDDKGSGRSGVCGYKGSIRVRSRLYKKKVILLVRTDCSVAIRCLSKMVDGVSHVLSLLEEGDVEEGQKGFEFLWFKIDSIKSNEKSLLEMLRMCHILKRKEESRSCLKMLREFGITSESNGKIIAETATTFPDNSFEDDIKEVIKSSPENKISVVWNLCKGLSFIEPKFLLQIFVNDILEDHPLQLVRYNDYYGFKDDPKTITVLNYMFNENLYPDPELDKLISKIGTLTTMVSAVTLTIDNQNVNVLNHLMMQFVKLASQVPTSRQSYEPHWHRVVHSEIKDIFNAIVSGLSKWPKLAVSVSTLVNTVTSLPEDLQQKLIKPFFKEIVTQYDSNKENLPGCLQEAIYLLRIKVLEETVSKGEPKYNWNQPNASVPEHSDVEAFLKGPNRSMVFGRNTFGDTTDAKRWASRYSDHQSCYNMTVTSSGNEKNDVVTIVKTAEGFNRQVAFYRACVKEYLGLLKFLPNRQSVIPKRSGQIQFVTAGKDNQTR